MARTAELRKAQASGKQIVCMAPGYEWRTVFYSPRSRTDPSPWRLAGDAATNGYRYSGGECRAVNAPCGKVHRDAGHGCGNCRKCAATD